MSRAIAKDRAPDMARTFDQAAKGPAGRRRDTSPLTLRLTREERARLEDMAAGMTLSAYVRGCLFAEQSKRRKRRPAKTIEDRQAIAEALALLGQSRIASNLNQLAYHANIGQLFWGEAQKTDIAEANAHLKAIRTLLMHGLGKTP